MHPGRKVVVTGKSGSGKSALLALFSGLYEEYEGTVSVNDLSLEYINLEKYRGMVGDFLELQEIFNGSIRENILMGRDFDQSHLEYILDLVGLKEYLYRLPEGLEAMLQPQGRGLPKSLAQKILLARGFVGKPKALIMENVLQHVETEVQSKIIDYLFNGNWTLLMVSYDEDVLSRADEVVMMASGQILYHGNYEGYKNLKN
ncbi:ATP-binding cassette domain-containing protein [Algoriphagus boritolerans]|uniref:ATP-binding cassette domain-containing protein n=1 Tax=Algoriphagus boritolerans TaxID=308111 RepID=UPI002FCDF368